MVHLRKDKLQMKITDIRFHRESFLFEKPFKVAFGVIKDMESLLLVIETDAGIQGYGEAAPLPFVTGDDFETTLCVGKVLREALIGEDPLAIGHIHQIMDSLYHGNTPIKAGIDLACYDIAAKNAGVPLYQYLGGASGKVHSDVTIGISTPEEMADTAAEWVEKGFSILKVKLGEDIATDVRRIAAIRDQIGYDIPVKVDANQGWTVKEALQIIPRLAKLGVNLVEQPVPAEDVNGLKEIRDRSELLIAADESCHSYKDAFHLASERAADVMNIKLMKCGGIYNALKICAICEGAGLACMIGCMGESSLANVAAMHLAAAMDVIKDVDLDTVYLLKQNKISGGFTHEGGKAQLTDQPGIGCNIKEEF